MRSTSETKNLNIEVSTDLHRRLTEFERLRDIKSHREFIEKAMEEGFEDAYIQILEVDGEAPSRHNVLFQFNECVHRWDGEKFISYDEEQASAILRMKRGG